MLGNIIETIGQSCWKNGRKAHFQSLNNSVWPNLLEKKNIGKDRPTKSSQSTSNLRFATVGCFGKKVNQNNFEPNGGEIHGTIRKKNTLNKFIYQNA